MCSLFLLARNYWYPAVVLAGFAFCSLEIAFVLILTLTIFAASWRVAVRSLAVFGATVLVVWPAAVYKLSFIKSYLFMAYLALFRKSPWGEVGFVETWRGRLLDSPLEWAAILVGLLLFFRAREKRPAYPFLVYGVLMVLATLRVLTNSPRYSLLFMPALDVTAALVVWFARPAVYAVVALFCGLLGFTEYRIFARPRPSDPRPAALLGYIRQHQLEEKMLLVPQDDLPAIHYYFPRTRLRGYYGQRPGPSDFDQFAPDEILER